MTDYSSIFFDFANLKKPMLFYMYDFAEYKDKLRDFYISLNELPGDIVYTQKELETYNRKNASKSYDKKLEQLEKQVVSPNVITNNYYNNSNLISKLMLMTK